MNPLALLLGGICGLVVMVMMKYANQPFLWKMLGLIVGFAAGFLISQWRLEAE